MRTGRLLVPGAGGKPQDRVDKKHVFEVSRLRLLRSNKRSFATFWVSIVTVRICELDHHPGPLKIFKNYFVFASLKCREKLRSSRPFTYPIGISLQQSSSSRFQSVIVLTFCGLCSIWGSNGDCVWFGSIFSDCLSPP